MIYDRRDMIYDPMTLPSLRRDAGESLDKASDLQSSSTCCLESESCARSGSPPLADLTRRGLADLTRRGSNDYPVVVGPSSNACRRQLGHVSVAVK